MPGFLPQGFMYNARGNMPDGNSIRNRSGEQRLGYSGGNPGMPGYNQPAKPMRMYAGKPQMPQFNHGSVASAPQTMQQGGLDLNAVNANPGAYQAYLQQAQQNAPNSWAAQQSMSALNSGPIQAGRGNMPRSSDWMGGAMPSFAAPTQPGTPATMNVGRRPMMMPQFVGGRYGYQN